MTSHTRNDDDLRAALRDLRLADEQAAPGFDAVLVQKRRARVIDAWRLVAVAVAASVLLVASVGVTRRLTSRRAPLVVPAEVIALSTWQPMTDVLLDTPNRSLLSETPRLDASMLEIVADSAPEPDSALRW